MHHTVSGCSLTGRAPITGKDKGSRPFAGLLGEYMLIFDTAQEFLDWYTNFYEKFTPKDSISINTVVYPNIVVAKEHVDNRALKGFDQM